jgi:ABC-type transport system involved in cytochrome c biogenesis permease subunit
MHTVQVGHAPLAGQGQAVSVFVWLAALSYLYVELTTDERTMGLFIITLLAVLFIVPLTSPDPTERPAVLDSPLFVAHVITVLFAYASFALACVVSVTYLLLFRELKRKQPGLFFARLPPLRALDLMNIRAVTIAMFFFTVSLLIGVIWIGEARVYAPNDARLAQMSLGDPKILIAVISWLLYAFQIFARQVIGWGGRRAAWLSVLGFASILVNLLPVGYFVTTSHTFN